MFESIAGLSTGVIGVEAVGKIEADDYTSVLDPAIDKAIASYGKVRILLVLGDRYEGFTGGAAWQDAKLGLHDIKAWERIAFVSDHKGTVDTIRMMSWMVPGEVHTFSLAELAEAKAWLSEAA
jgi:hypothetical protein